MIHTLDAYWKRSDFFQILKTIDNNYLSYQEVIGWIRILASITSNSGNKYERVSYEIHLSKQVSRLATL